MISDSFKSFMVEFSRSNGGRRARGILQARSTHSWNAVQCSGIWDLQDPITSLLIDPSTNWVCFPPASHSSSPKSHQLPVFHREIVLQELLSSSAGDLLDWEDARVMNTLGYSRWDIQGNALAFPWELQLLEGSFCWRWKQLEFHGHN